MWILVGMMGAGKSSAARALGKLVGRPVLDTDQLLQNRFGRSVAQIFAVYGELAFRQHETNILRGLEPTPAVLSTGGGIVTRPENWDEMRRLGTTVYLEGSTATLAARLRASKRRRPLLEVENWEDRLEAILAERRRLYEQADLRCSIDGRSLEEIVIELRAKFEEEAR
ncbi:MAG: shikimate kinase [Fimbriimonadaceae bacterium]|nr:shikimate kinase [Chthonomonadaceae bacterium]MCO5296476.1 shikimate kinase [Fimbriimonadaceae bacterium]